jgi:protein ImuB
LEPSQFELLLGPERIEAGWWDGDDARRDYFVARLADGALAWVYREADLSSPTWRLHGLFA